MNQQKETALQALQYMRGDDLQRAQAAFRGCTPEQMQSLYYASGQTRQEIIDGYRAHQDRVDAAIAWVQAQQ